MQPGEPMPSKLDEFRAYRQRMNDPFLEIDLLGIKRFFNLGTNAHKASRAEQG